MFRSYLSFALRNLKKTALFSFINVAGLSIGISSAIVIYLIVQYEFNFDRFHPNGDRLFRLVTKVEFPGLTIHNTGAPVPTAPAAIKEIPAIEAAARFLAAEPLKVAFSSSTGEQKMIRKQVRILYTEPSYFELIQYKWIAGDRATALNEPYKVVLTSSRAKSYFGNSSPADLIGKNITYDDSITARVSGIVADFDKPTEFDFKEFISLATVQNTGLRDRWNFDVWNAVNANAQTFVLLHTGASPASVAQQINGIRSRHREDKNETQRDNTTHVLQPLRDIHFTSDYGGLLARPAHKPALYGLLAVAIFLLVLGCINFINLTTANAAKRAKEIGIRKTLGSARKQLVAQFLIETLLLTFTATLLSIALMPWLLHVFRDFIPAGVSFASILQPHVIVFLLLLMSIVTLLAGFYPAIVLTRFKPVTVLKNQSFEMTSQSRKAWLRKTLTVSQFAITQLLVIATLVVGKQIHYSINRELGYRREAIVSFEEPHDFFVQTTDDRRFRLLEELKKVPGIAKISLAGPPPASYKTYSLIMKHDPPEQKPIEANVEVMLADSLYFDLYDLKLVAGRLLRKTDSIHELVINEACARAFGFRSSNDAIGKFIGSGDPHSPIVGVVEDFHSKSTHEAIKPLAFTPNVDQGHTFHLLLEGNNTQDWSATISKAGNLFRNLYPEEDFSYEFFDDSIAAFYQTERNTARLLAWSAGLCIFICCLGLLGLVIFITNSRTKEIGIRKVFGASVMQIVTLLSKEVAALVLLAFLIAVPIAWWLMNSWLQDFVYRTTLSWWIFAATASAMLLIAIAIMSLRTIKTAMLNPARSLRSE
jgi:putative ABC transport system permease protein